MLYLNFVVFCVSLNVALTQNRASDTEVIRQTLCGRVRGVLREIHKGKPVESFLGIPYAKPPINDLRFEKPEDTDCWHHHIRNTTHLPPACLQISNNFGYIQRHRPGFSMGSEDCLYLNIHLPHKSRQMPKLPVVVFIHGGSNIAGMGAFFDGDTFTAFSGLILVTLNYRIGSLGFLGTGRSEFPGNYGMLDQIQALKWVKKNIEFFNGDANNVTIIGHSSGAFSVGLHVLSPLSRGLFKAAICMSGSVMAPITVGKQTGSSDRVLKLISSKLNCYKQTLTEIKQCLKTIPASLLVTDFQPLGHQVYSFSVLIDGHFLRDYPEQVLKHDPINVQSMFGGVTRDEGSSLLYETDPSHLVTKFLIGHRIIDKNQVDIIDVMKHEYTDWGSGLNRYTYSKLVGDGLFDAPLSKSLDLMYKYHRGTSLYFYRFEYVSSRARNSDVLHGSDLYYLFGSPLSGDDLFNYTDKDKLMSRIYISLFANFARAGVPSIDRELLKETPTSDTEFQEYSPELHHYIALNTTLEGTPQAVGGWKLKQREFSFWNDLIPKVKKMCRQPDTDTIISLPNHPPDSKVYIILFSVFLSTTVLLIVVLVIYIIYKNRQILIVSL